MRSKFLPPLVLFVAALGFAAPNAAAQKRKPPRIKPITATVTVSASKPTPAQRRQDAFLLAWSTLNEAYFDKTFGGLDWNKIRAEYKPRVDRAQSDLEFHRILEEMINRLGKSHLNLIVPEYFEKIEAAKERARTRGKELAAARKHASAAEGKSGADDEPQPFDDGRKRYGIGVRLRMLGGQLVVTRVEEQSGARVAGIKPGYVIEKINSVSIKEITNQIALGGVSIEKLRDLLALAIEEGFLNGEPDTSVFLTCLDENDQVKEFTVPRLQLDGDIISIGKHFPEQLASYESRSLSPDIGYIRFNAFVIPVVEKFCDSITEFRTKKAIIVDLRGNLGGLLSPMIGLSGMLTEKTTTLGTFYSRTGEQKFTVPSKVKNFKGRIVLLVDRQSLSAAEIFAAGLRSNDRAVLVGEQTGGQSLPAVWTKLPTGAVMMYPISDFHPLGGTSLEGVGIRPDHPVVLDRKSLLAGIDAQLQRAIAVASDESVFAKLSTTARSTENTAKPPEIITGSEEAPPPPAKLSAPKPLTPPANDERSLRIVSDFATALGGREAVKKLTSYEVRGKMVANEDTELEGDIYAVWQAPNKLAVVLQTTSVGEVRSVYNGKNSFQETDYGLSGDAVPVADPENADFFAPYFRAMDLDYLKGLKYEGEWEVDGRMRHALSATNLHGQSVGLSFYSDTKLLASFSLPGSLFTFGDYRKVDGIMIPFRVEINRVMDVRLSTVKLNSTIDPSEFAKRDKCFDKAN